MYEIITVKDTIRIPPKFFSDSIEKSAVKALEEQYIGKINKEYGAIICILNPRDISDGRVILGDGATYHDIVFDLLVFKPELHEIVRAKVSDITEFGAFLRFGPIDGLVHVSQIANDFVSYNEKTQNLVGKSGKYTIKKGDEVLARIIAVSLKDTIAESKINLTMRQAGLGKEEWNKGGKKSEEKEFKKEEKMEKKEKTKEEIKSEGNKAKEKKQ